MSDVSAEARRAKAEAHAGCGFTPLMQTASPFPQTKSNRTPATN
jgi:hypothetical protein